MDTREYIFPWRLWLFGALLFLFPLRPSVIGVEAWQWLVGWERVLFLGLTILGLYLSTLFSVLFSLNNKLVLGSAVFSLLLFVHEFLVGRQWAPTPLSVVFILLPLVVPWAAMLFRRYRYLLLVFVLSILAFHAQWGWVQFIIQEDLGLSLAGESVLSPDIPGVAKFQLGTEKILRAYGPYAHANNFGGALLIGILLLIPVFFTRPVTAPDRNTLYWQYFMLTLVFVLMGGALFSFSRLMIAGLFLAIFPFLFWQRKFGEVPRRTLLVFFLSLVVLAAGLILLRWLDPASTSLAERVRGVSLWMNIFDSHDSLLGIGVGNYPQALSELVRAAPHLTVKPWELTYVHSVPLLALVELGIGLSAVLLATLAFALRSSWRWLFILPLLPPLAFDHFYYSDGSAVLWLVVLLVLITTRGESGVL